MLLCTQFVNNCILNCHEKMQQVKKRHNFTLRDVLQYILNLEVKTFISGLILFIATFSSCNTFLSRLDTYLYNCKESTTVQQTENLIYWAYGKNINSGYLKHVFAVLDRLGYKNNPNTSDWDLLWAHDYPFRTLYTQLNHLKPHQKVNHFPGCGYITNKVDLSTSGLNYMPPAFKLPDQKQKFLNYTKAHPDKIFVTKSNDHRGIKIQKAEEIDLNREDVFLQEYVDKPYLVDGYKFDIGVYTIVTSIDPLRIYIYNGDILFRYCPVKYYPFDPENLDKYVVGDDYLPTWEVPSLKYYYNELGFSMKDSFNAYVEKMGQDHSLMWRKIEDAITHAILNKEEAILNVMQRFKSKGNFFEMMRFDFVLDENLEVFLMEANMSPNLSSAHYPPNRLLYEQVLYNLFSLIGLAERVQKRTTKSLEEQLMLTADKNIAVFPTECSSSMCQNSCMSPICQICKPCLSPETKSYLIEAYQEHINRQDCKRIFPPPMEQKYVNSSVNLETYSAENQLLYRWFIGKCLLDSSWC